ncbi:MAG: TatD family hydrolase [Endozoicomonadaceae bacterium]|nr:TatD family hydrolase [Endozoicomonadaceae bacterium]
MFIDSHCHLDRLKLDPYEGDISKAISAAFDNGVSGILSVCINLEHFQPVLDMTRFDNVWASVGVHPLDLDGQEPAVETLIQLSDHPKVVAIGEAGLDYYYSKDRKQQQQSWFVMQLTAAAEQQLPIIVHTRQAREDTLALIASHGSRESAGVMHCFTESWDMAKKAMDMNFYISFSGIVTFKNASDLREIACKVPLDRLLIETDSPYLAPIPFRGKSNEPKYVPEVGKVVAELRGISVEELAEQTTHNFFTLFHKAAV